MTIKSEVINLDSSMEEEHFVSLLGGKPNEKVQLEVVDVDYEQDAIDNIIWKASDFDIEHNLVGDLVKYKNKIFVTVIANDISLVRIDEQQMNEILDDIFEGHERYCNIDWTFNDCDLELLKAVYYNIRMLVQLYSYVSGYPHLVNIIFSHEVYLSFIQFVHCFESDSYLNGDWCKLEFDEQKEYIRSRVPKYCRRYQSGKRKGQAYWRYGWNKLMMISCDIAVSPIASNNKRFMLIWGSNFLDHTFIFTFNKLVIDYTKQLSDSQSDSYFPLWCRIRLIAYWSVSSKLDKLNFQDANIVFIGPLQSFQGGSSEEIIV